MRLRHSRHVRLLAEQFRVKILSGRTLTTITDPALRMKLSLEWRPQPGLANTRVRAVRVTGR